MKRTQELFEKIEEYLTKKLPQEEVVAFEKEIANDEELKREVEIHRELQRVLSNAKTLALKNKLKKIHQEVIEEEKAKKNKGGRLAFLQQHSSSYWKVAATIIIVLGIGNLIWNNFRETNKISDLYISHYVPYPAEDTTRGVSNNDLDMLMQQYTKGEYTSVINELEKLHSLSKIEQLRLYLGNSYLNTGREKEAIEQFEQVNDTSQFYEDATWYKALTYLKLGKAKKSIPILEEIISQNGIYKEKALDLIQKLKN